MPKKKEQQVKPTCPQCGSGNVYVIADGTIIVCRRCGKRTTKEESTHG